MATCACGKHEIPDNQAAAQAEQAAAFRDDAVQRAESRAAHRAQGANDENESCGCGGSGQGGLGLRSLAAHPGAQPVDQSHGRRQLGLRGL
ncbi:MAG: hypothetical protein MR006_08045 [Arcanobacterium sp.]|nr:hypothetical protein [Arcanobacterium sp.]